MSKKLVTVISVALAAAAILVAQALGAFSVTLGQQTDTTLTLTWEQAPGAGYRYLVNGSLVSHTWDAGVTSATFGKVEGATYTVERLQVADSGTYTFNTPPPPPPPPTGTVIERNGAGYRCTGPINVDLLRVTSPPGDALTLGTGCTGRIGRVEITQFTTDGIKVSNASTNAAHDLVIESGFVRCPGIADGAHQDGIQVMGGRNLLFKNLHVDCQGHSNFFVNRGGGGATTPTNVVCENCRLDDGGADPSSVINAVNSGLRNTVGCRSVRFNHGFEWGTASQLQGRVDEGNTLLAAGSAGCKTEP